VILVTWSCSNWYNWSFINNKVHALKTNRHENCYSKLTQTWFSMNTIGCGCCRATERVEQQQCGCPGNISVGRHVNRGRFVMSECLHQHRHVDTMWVTLGDMTLVVWCKWPMVPWCYCELVQFLYLTLTRGCVTLKCHIPVIFCFCTAWHIDMAHWHVTLTRHIDMSHWHINKWLMFCLKDYLPNLTRFIMYL